MISGNKNTALASVQAIVVASLKDAFGSNINWEVKSCERAIKEFTMLSVTIAAAVLENMKDCGDVPYIMGKPTGDEIRFGASLMLIHYLTEKDQAARSYYEKKFKLFVDALSGRIKTEALAWKAQAKQYFNEQRKR